MRHISQIGCIAREIVTLEQAAQWFECDPARLLRVLTTIRDLADEISDLTSEHIVATQEGIKK